MADSSALSRTALLVAAVLLLGAGLGATDFWAPDEPRYGQIAEELRSLEHGPAGVVLLHLGGEPYTQKPPLYYWLAALAGAVPGRVSEAAARLPSALAGMATVAICFAFARRLFPGGCAGLLSGAFLLSSFRFAHLARRAQLDVLLTAFETLALFAYWRIVASSPEETPERAPRRTRWLVLLHAALGAAALTKGPVGWMPLLVMAAHLAWEGRPGALRSLLPPWALLLSVAPVLAWIAGATALAPAGFFQEAVVDNLLGRVVDADSHVRPVYYYLYQLPADFLPWTLLLPFAVAFLVRTTRPDQREKRERRETRKRRIPSSWRLLVVWVVVPLAVLSLASGKRGLYLLPTFPALAMMLGGALDGWRRDADRLPAVLRGGLLAVGIALLAAAAGLAASGGFASERHPGFGVSSTAFATVAGVVSLGLAAAWLLRRPLPRMAPLVAAVATVIGIEAVAFLMIYPENDEEKSPRSIARLAAELTRPDEPVGIFDDEGLAGGLLYYGPRPAEILPRPEHVARFLDGGGRFVVLERWKLPWLAPVGRFHVHASTRRDRRELVVVRRVSGPQTPP